MLRRDSRCDSACGWLRMARPSRSRSRSGDFGAKCSSRVAFAKATILTIIALDARFPNKSESAFGVEAGFESSSESLKIVYCDRPFCEDPLVRHVKPCTAAPDCQESRWASAVPIGCLSFYTRHSTALFVREIVRVQGELTQTVNRRIRCIAEP